MINKKDIRNYEVSIWTLQDSFITVLKPFNLENKGAIQEPKMELKDDGDNTFSFKIPMYIKENSNIDEEPYFKKNSELKENPIWYNVRNGNIVANMRKIKVIFNKNIPDKEKIFEFIITNVKETHNNFEKNCEVSCEGLAFHELGKQGYNISLLHDDYLQELYNWYKDQTGPMPIENINYWIEKVLKNSYWNYEIDMDWSLYNNSWDKHKVYKGPYVSSWNIISNGEEEILTPSTTILDSSQLEKILPMEEKESNRYNLLQKIAETFEVYCKFEYSYDDNYHIIDRKVIFYNNFINEQDGIIDLNYGYDTTQITREMDSIDLVSKMFVQNLKDSGTFSGEIKISDSAANLALENYILNFDYLYKIGTIAEDQYQEIKDYQRDLHKINSEILKQSYQQLYYNYKKPLLEAKKTVLESFEKEASTRIANFNSQLIAIGNGNVDPSYTDINPLSFLVIFDEARQDYYIIMNRAFGELNQNSFRLYKEKNNNTGEVIPNSLISSEDISFEKDSDGLVTKVRIKTLSSNISYVYATFSYKPNVPTKKMLQLWGSQLKDAQDNIENITNKINDIEEIINNYNDFKDAQLKEKEKKIINFERLMGAALREGTWTPEDNYASCQSNHIFLLNDFLNNSSENENVGFTWDKVLFEDNILDAELKIDYYYYLENEMRYYPCILLNDDIIDQLRGKNNIHFVYRNCYWLDGDRHDPTKNYYLSINTEEDCQFAFLRNDKTNEIKPALIIVGAKNVIDTKIDSILYKTFDQIKQQARLSEITYDSTNGDMIETEIISDLTNYWVNFDQEKYSIVYPRFYNTYFNFLTTTPINMIYCGETALEKDKDYYILFRTNQNGKIGHYLTIKPEVAIFNLHKNYKFCYALSTAADAIYLDALKVMKENSSPKVSYSITPLLKNIDFIKEVYNKIGQLVHINDIELKFENVQGYISEVNLNLDKPWEDTYTIKNYKTKFEDLFSSIVAQTQSMQRNSQAFTMASNLFDSRGNINSEILNSSIQNAGTINTFGLLTNNSTLAIPIESDAVRIINGDIGLAFPKTDNIESIILNNNIGLRIDGLMRRLEDNGDYTSIPSYFRVTNGAMGFFKKGTDHGQDEGMLYFDALKGDMALKGGLYAKWGWFGGENGWIIGDGEFHSINNKAIFTAGESLTSPTIELFNNENEAILKFNNNNLYIKGAITADTGYIGGETGWVIKPNLLYSSSLGEFNNGRLDWWDTNANDFKGGIYLKNNINTSELGIYTKGMEEPLVKLVGGENIDTPFIIGDNNSGIKLKYNLLNKQTSLIVKGEIEATLGHIGGWKISSEGLSKISDYFYYDSEFDMKTELKLNNNINSASQLSNIAFEVSQIKHSRNENTDSYGNRFYVTYNGALYANEADIDGGKIGDWLLFKQMLASGLNTNYFTYVNANSTISDKAFLAGNGNFYVKHDGYLYASNANIIGTITATNGFISNWNIDGNGIWRYVNDRLTGMMTWESSAQAQGRTIGLDDVAFIAGSGTFSVTNGGKLTATEAVIQGDITATGGTIGGCSIDANGLHVDAAHISSVNASAIKAGTINADISLSAATITGGSISIGGTNFHVDSNGYMTCHGATINGSGSFSGTINAGGGTISGWNIDGNGIWKRVNGDHNLVGMMTWEGANGNVTDNTQAFVAGDGRFSVTYGGQMTATGAVINGATQIDTDGTNFSVKNGEFFSMKAITEVVEGENSGRLTFKVRGKLNNILYDNSIEVTPGNTSFSRMAIFSGGAYFPKGFQTVQGDTIYSLTSADNSRLYSIVVSTSSPVFHPDCSRMLWIEPYGSWDATNPDLALMSCRVHWCAKYGTY